MTLGDYVDYGSDSRSVIDQLIRLSRRCRLVPLLGNHKEMLLQALESDSALRSWLDLGGERTLLSCPYDGVNIIDPAHVAFLQGCLDFLRPRTSSSRTPTSTRTCRWTSSFRSN